MKFNSNFPVLSILAILFFYGGLLLLLVSLLTIVGVFGRTNDSSQGVAFYLIFVSLLLMIIGEIIGVLFAIELNTRKLRVYYKKSMNLSRENESEIESAISENLDSDVVEESNIDQDDDSFNCFKCGIVIPEGVNKCPKCGMEY